MVPIDRGVHAVPCACRAKDLAQCGAGEQIEQLLNAKNRQKSDPGWGTVWLAVIR